MIVSPYDVWPASGQPHKPEQPTLNWEALDSIRLTISGPATHALGHEENYWSIRRLAALEDYYRNYARVELLAGREPMSELVFWWERIINPPDRNQAIDEAVSFWVPEDHPGFPTPPRELVEAAMLAAIKAYVDWPKVVESKLVQLVVKGWEDRRNRLAARIAQPESSTAGPPEPSGLKRGLAEERDEIVRQKLRDLSWGRKPDPCQLWILAPEQVKQLWRMSGQLADVCPVQDPLTAFATRQKAMRDAFRRVTGS